MAKECPLLNSMPSNAPVVIRKRKPSFLIESGIAEKII